MQDTSSDLNSSGSVASSSPPVANHFEPTAQDVLERCASMGTLMRFKHTSELLALGPRETQRALVEIQEGAVLNRFYCAADDMGLRRERYHTLRTVEELDGILRRIRWALRTVQWNAKRLANICRWLLRSIRMIQRFAKMYLPKLRRMKASVLRMWNDAMSKAAASLQRQTMEHVRRYRITLQHQSFRDEAFGLLLDCHVPLDEVQAAIESLWRFRCDEYRLMFRRRQRESRVRAIQNVSSMQTQGTGASFPPPLIGGRRQSMMATKTLTFRSIRLKRIQFDVPSLMFGVENVSLAELCVHHRLLKLRQLHDNIASYKPSSGGKGESTVDLLSSPLRLSPFTVQEQSLRAAMLENAKRHKVPATYLHALLTIDSTTQWFLLYMLRQLHKGGMVAAQGHVPEVMQGCLESAVNIASKWGIGTITTQAQHRRGNQRPSISVRGSFEATENTRAQKTKGHPVLVLEPPLVRSPRVALRRLSPARLSSAPSPSNTAEMSAARTPKAAQSSSHVEGQMRAELSPRSVQWARAVSPLRSRSPPDDTRSATCPLPATDRTDCVSPVAAAPPPIGKSLWFDALANHNTNVRKARLLMKQRSAALALKVAPRGRAAGSPAEGFPAHTPRTLSPQQPGKGVVVHRPTTRPRTAQRPPPPSLESILTSRKLMVVDEGQPRPSVPLVTPRRPASAPALGRH